MGLALGRAKIVPITTDQKADPGNPVGNMSEAGIEHEGNSRRKGGYRDKTTVLRITEILTESANPPNGPRPKRKKIGPPAAEGDDEAPKAAKKAPAKKAAAKPAAKKKAPAKKA